MIVYDACKMIRERIGENPSQGERKFCVTYGNSSPTRVATFVASNFQTRERAKRANSGLDQVDTKMISEVFINNDAKWCLTA